MIFLKRWSMHRFPWFLLMATGICAIGYALYLQIYHYEMPCYYCVTDRFYLTLISLAGLIGFINPRFFLTRIVGILLFLYAAAMGTYNGYLHLNIIAKFKANPFTLDSCPIVFDYLNGLPQKLLPMVFTPQGNCNSGGPVVFGLNLVEWTAVFFVALLITAVAILVSQVRSVPTKRRRLM